MEYKYSKLKRPELSCVVVVCVCVGGGGGGGRLLYISDTSLKY